MRDRSAESCASILHAEDPSSNSILNIGFYSTATFEKVIKSIFLLRVHLNRLFKTGLSPVGHYSFLY